MCTIVVENKLKKGIRCSLLAQNNVIFAPNYNIYYEVSGKFLRNNTIYIQKKQN